ncbi:MAG: hypothetical protein IJ225_11385 [Solobacterium sp.]|nr:hypothetical protein [Solobacterium sp.]
MKSTAAIEFIRDHTDFTTSEFADALYKQSPQMARSTIYQILRNLCEEGEITRTSRGHFSISRIEDYSYPLSNTGKEIASFISKSYPLVTFQIWELYQMNEFVNHQISRNTVFVEVETMHDESVFNLLFENYPHVLLNPTKEEYYRYSGKETIVVKKIISEAPPSYGEMKQATLEKILVDLFARGISGSIISKSEYPAIYEDSFKRYHINQPKMFRYARRRGIEGKIRTFIHEQTSINLDETICL